MREIVIDLSYKIINHIIENVKLKKKHKSLVMVLKRERIDICAMEGMVTFKSKKKKTI